jgi:predicted secreted protein
MTEIDAKRAYVAGMYPSQRWKTKVANMPDAQVVAIYMRDQEKKSKNDKPKESGEDDIPF